jgi:hypothetical protein
MYPEIGYFELGKVIDDLNLPKKATKGSRMITLLFPTNVSIQRFSECFFSPPPPVPL